jgi:hypothetical protein
VIEQYHLLNSEGTSAEFSTAPLNVQLDTDPLKNAVGPLDLSSKESKGTKRL